MRNVRGFILALFFLCGSAALSRGADDGKLQYQFKGADRIFYRLTEKIEDSQGASATIAYLGFEPKAFRTEIDLKYGASMSTQPMALGGVMPDIQPNPNLFEHDWGNRVKIDFLGKVLGNESHQDTGLPGAIAQNWQMALPELGAQGQKTWQSTRTIALVQRMNMGFGHFIPMSPIHGNATMATITNNYTLQNAEAGTDDKTASVDFNSSMDTQGNGPLSEHASGNGSFIFDIERGLVRSLNEKLDLTVSVNGKDEHGTVTVDLKVLEQAQVDQMIADAKTRTDQLNKLKERIAAQQAKGNSQSSDSGAGSKEKDNAWVDSLDLPADTAHTDFVGGQGGGPFVKAGDGTRPMVGLKYQMGHWSRPCIGSVEPLYDKPDAEPTDKNDIIVLAKDGYVVGGLWANSSDGLAAIRVIFMKKTDAGVDLKDAYVSPWICKPIGGERIKLGCNGQWVVGLYGRQGLNTDGVGLVMKAAPGADPTDDPNYAGTNVPAKPAAK
jgi:hypothetical protein